MPAYSKTNWVDGSVPAIDATNLNKIEQGIFDSLRQDGSTTMSGQLVTTAGTVTTPAIAPTGDANTGIFFPAADTIAFGEGGVEAMRINSSGNVGIGTNSPADRLHIKGVQRIESSNAPTSNHAKLQLNASASVDYGLLLEHVNDGVTDANFSLGGKDTVGFIAFGTNTAGNAATTRMVITEIGRVGIGTTIPANIFSVVSATGQTGLNAGTVSSPVKGNLWYDTDGSGWKFQIGKWQSSAFTAQMTFQDNGNVGIGTTSPANLLDVSASGDPIISTYRPVNVSAGIGRLRFDGNNSSSSRVNYSFVQGEIETATAGSHAGNLVFYTANSGTLGEKMRITSGGNVGIGTSSPSGKLHVQSTASTTIPALRVASSASLANNDIIRFQIDGLTNGFRMFQDSSSNLMYTFETGNVGIGTTSPSVKLQVVDASDAKIQSVRTGGCTVQIEGGGSAGFLKTTTNHNLVIGTNNADSMTLTTAGYLLIGYTSSNGAYPLQVNGQIFATSSTIATSDGRYKKDVVSLDGALDIVKALNPVQFSWKDHPVHKFNTDVPTVGFVAQEVAEVLKDKAYLTSLIKKSECTWETETGEFVDREVTRDVEKQVEREITEEIDGEEVTRTVTETVIEQVTEIVTEPVKETHTEEFLGIAESNLIAILTKAVKELTAKVEALEAQLNK